MGRLVDLAGSRYARLMVIERAPRPAGVVSAKAHWLCRCDCGAETVVRSDHLRSGSVQSCGCLNIELVKTRNVGEGEQHPAWVGDRIQYQGMHNRVIIARGRASTHQCVDCTSPSGRMEWSWEGCDEPKVQVGGKANGCLYCLHVEHYEPRCKGCHEAFDAA